jgi:hypothetical protein
MTASANHDLTDLATLKAELNLTNIDAARDAVLNRYIAASSQQLETYCNRRFAAETIEDRFFPPRDPPFRIAVGGADPLQLSRWPIISIASVTENGKALAAGTDFLADSELGHLTRLDVISYPTKWDAWPIVAQYKAGFTTLPADLVDACIQLVKWRYFSRLRDPGVRSENVSGVYEAQYWLGTGLGGPDDLPAEVAAKVARYRLPVVAAA